MVTRDALGDGRTIEHATRGVTLGIGLWPAPNVMGHLLTHDRRLGGPADADDPYTDRGRYRSRRLVIGHPVYRRPSWPCARLARATSVLAQVPTLAEVVGVSLVVTRVLVHPRCEASRNPNRAHCRMLPLPSVTLGVTRSRRHDSASEYVSSW
jgi:hypothetical protein